LRVIADLTPRRAWLTGISHKLAHAATQTGLPPNVHLACDGLRVTVD
jgi:phosphoribosyl 1,2-cyclic phosphodiesterase